MADDTLELPPLSPSMERVLSEALADLSEMERSGDPSQMKVELPAVQRNWLQDEDGISSLRMATPPSVSKNQEDNDSISPSGRDFKDAPDARRARRSAIEKKSRQRRQQMMKSMSEEVKRLEQVYVEAEANTQLRIYRPLRSMSDHELQRKYSELLMAAHALEEDQAALRELIQSHELFEQTVRSFSTQREGENAVWDDGILPSSSFGVKFRQLPPAECYAIVKETYREIQTFSQDSNFQSTGASFMGWTDKRKYEPKLQELQFGFTKQFPLDTPENLLARTWDVFSSGPKMADMSFDRSVRTRFEVLQVLNENLFIIRRDHKIPSMPISFASVQVIFRLETPTGYAMCMRTISAPEIERAMEPHEYFYDVFHWTRFNRIHDEHGNPAGCEIMAGGSIKDQNQLQSTYWLFEIMCSVLRWEHACVAPLLLKQI